MQSRGGVKQSGFGSGPQTLRQMNCAAVLRAIRATGWARARELMAATGLSRPTVTAAVSQLIEDGWVEEAESPDGEPPRMGRPARVLRFRANARHVLGIDVGPHKVYCAAADLNGTVVAHVRRDVGELGSPEDLLDLIEAATSQVIAEVPISASALASVGVGSPGVVDAQRGVIMRTPSVPGWDSLALGQRLQRHIPCPVHVENDVNLAVMAEQWSGVGGQADSLVLIHWGARVGGAVLVHGRLHRGSRGAAGEIGFVDVSEEPPEGGGARLGPFEAQVGTAWILERARGLGDQDSPDAAAVLKSAAAGDPRALGVIDEACARFARGLAPFLAAIDPELVVLGGSIALAGECVLEAVRRHLDRRALVVPRMELSALGDEAVALGAVRLALADAERRLLDGYAPSNTGAEPQ